VAAEISVQLVWRGRGLGSVGQSGLQVGSCRADLIRGGEEVTDALLRQLAVLVVVEGLAGELAEEGRTRRANGGRTDEPLCAVTRRHTEEHRDRGLKRYITQNITTSP